MTDLHEILGIDPLDPEYVVARRVLDERDARAVSRPCILGNCTLWIDPLDGKVFGAVGVAGCPCDDEPAPDGGVA